MRPARIEKMCTECAKAFLIPPCRDWREHQCSGACKSAARSRKSSALITERTRKCAVCESEFVVKFSQIVADHGKYCSLSCSRRAFAASDRAKEARTKAGETYKDGIKSGRIVRATGPDNPLWKQHPDRVVGQRFPLSEEQKDRVREVRRIYMARNKEKAREWSKRRGDRKTGRLPRGTVARIKELQRSKCAICLCGITSAFHVDHIMPLAKGGKHEPHNIQLLCPTCNVRKSAKHPIKFAQQLGRLL